MTSSTNGQINCQNCGKLFPPKIVTAMFCCKECRLDFRKAEKALAKPKRVLKCECCGIDFETNRSNARACSTKCIQKLSNLKIREQRRKQNEEEFAGILDIPTCKICGWKSRSLQSHLTTHDLTIDQYRREYNATDEEIFHSSFTAEKSSRMSGEANPGHNHGGTMSSFSKRYALYEGLDDSQKEAAILNQIKKANDTKDATAGYNTRVDFYQVRRGMTEEEAAAARSLRQSTFSLEKCVAMFGEVTGTALWEARQEKWQDTLNSLPREVRLDIRKRALLNRPPIHSLVATHLFEMLGCDGAMYGDNEAVVITSVDTVYRVDFMLGDKIIEFYGDYWHANPLVEKYASDDVVIHRPNRSLQTAGAIRAWDAKRISEIEQTGYKVLIIWESEYNHDREGTKAKCLEFLKE